MSRKFIGQYEVISNLGAGGMGTVVLARAPDGRLVVIKQPHAGDGQLRELLINEARVGLRLKHPFIVETVDFFELEGQVSLVLSYVSGVSLQDLREAGKVPLETICRVGLQISEALDALHSAADDMGRPLNVVHRDVTPGNIMIGHDGDARLIDLGIAKSDDRTMGKTQVGFLRGTIRYLAPEIFADSKYSPQSDLWALGISLLDAALGRPALPGLDPEVFARVMGRRIFELEPGEVIDPRLEKILRKLLSHQANKRPKRGLEAAALFSMLAKELGDTKEATCARVRVVAGVAAAPAKKETPRAESEMTELLVSQATSMFSTGGWGEPGGEQPVYPSARVPDGDATEASVPNPPAPATSSQLPPAEVLAAKPLVAGTPGPMDAGTFGTPPPAIVESRDSPDAPANPDEGAPDSLNDYLAGLRALEKQDPPTALYSPNDNAVTGPTKRAAVAEGVPRSWWAAGIGTVVLLGLIGFVVGQETKSDPNPLPTPVVVDLKDMASAPAGPAQPRWNPDRETVVVRRKRPDPLEAMRAKMPACWEPGRTRYFWYLNRRGTVVTTTKVSSVPKRYKKKIRCAE